MNIKTSEKTTQTQAQKTKKKSKFKKLFKYGGISLLLYATISVGFVIDKSNRLNDAVPESTFIKYSELENKIQDEDEFLKYYKGYNYTEEMFQKDLERYHKYEKWLYQQYQEMVKRNNLIDNMSEEEFNQIINNDKNHALDYKKWMGFEKLSVNMIEIGGLQIESLLSLTYLIKNDEKYNKMENYNDIFRYEENKKNEYFKNDSESNKSFVSLNKKQVFPNHVIEHYHPVYFELMNRKAAFEYPSVYQALYVPKGIYFKTKIVQDNAKNFSRELKEAYDFRKTHTEEEYEEKYQYIKLNEHKKINYDRDFQYNTFKVIHVFNHLSDQIVELISKNGEENLKIMDENNLFLLPVSYAYMAYINAVKDEDDLGTYSYSKAYNDDELFKYLSGIGDIEFKKEILKNENDQFSDFIFINNPVEYYPFLK